MKITAVRIVSWLILAGLTNALCKLYLYIFLAFDSLSSTTAPYAICAQPLIQNKSTKENERKPLKEVFKVRQTWLFLLQVLVFVSQFPKDRQTLPLNLVDNLVLLRWSTLIRRWPLKMHYSSVRIWWGNLLLCSKDSQSTFGMLVKYLQQALTQGVTAHQHSGLK